MVRFRILSSGSIVESDTDNEKLIYHRWICAEEGFK